MGTPDDLASDLLERNRNILRTSELCLSGGMRSQTIYCASNWFNRHPRYDTVLVQIGPDDVPLCGMAVCAFSSFDEGLMKHQCALVEWFDASEDEPDPITGMWMVEPKLHDGR